MSQSICVNEHAPVGYMDVLGCGGYQNTDKVICMIASAHNNFVNDGIVEGTLIFIDTSCERQRGNLNVYQYQHGAQTRYKLSRKDLPHAAFIGKAVMAINQF